MVDILIVRNKCDNATESTNWIGEGLKAHLEGKGHSVTDLSDADASPAKVQHWLNHGDSRTKKAAILLDHGGTSAFYGEQNNNTAAVITNTNCEDLTKELHVYTFACLTNADSGVGETAVGKGCLSWLGYKEVVYTMGSAAKPYDEFKQCIWSYATAMAEGKTMEQCEAVLRKAYSDRKSKHWVFGYNLDRLLLRKAKNNMTINSHNRAAKWHYGKKIDGLWVYGPEDRNAWVHVQGMGWKKLWTDHVSQVVAMMTMAANAKAQGWSVSFYEVDNRIKEIYA